MPDSKNVIVIILLVIMIEMTIKMGGGGYATHLASGIYCFNLMCAVKRVAV